VSLHPALPARPERLGQPGATSAAAASATAASKDIDQAPDREVWQLLGRADVIVRGVLEAQDRAERRLWEERARVWLGDVAGAWINTNRRAW
jgi:hypothetical protein